MTRDAKLAELAGDFSPEADELFAAVAVGLPRAAPPATLRSRLLDALAPQWFRFEAELAKLADVPLEKARAILATAEEAHRWVDGPVAGVSLLHIEAGPACAGADVGLVRLGAGVLFPPHEHLGPEEIVVLDGSYDDSAGYTLSPGSTERKGVGEAHHFVAGPNGVVFAVMLHTGIAFPNPAGGDPIVHRG